MLCGGVLPATDAAVLETSALVTKEVVLVF
jgi:hypothetical protein